MSAAAAPAESPRAVLVSAVPAADRRLTEAGTDPTGRGMSWITGRARVIELLREAVSAQNAQLQLDGSAVTIRIRLNAAQQGAGRALSGSGALECRAELGDFTQEPWSIGSSATVWFADAAGIFSFRVKVLGGTRVALTVGQPTCVVRYCRRSERRHAVPTGELPRVAVPLTDGTWWEGAGVRDLSTGGLRLALPAELPLALGRATRLGLSLHPGRFLELTAIARHLGAADVAGTTLYGVEFVDPSPVARMAIQRFCTRLAGTATPEDTFGLPMLPAAVSLTLRTARHDGLASGQGAASAPVPLAAAPVRLPSPIIIRR